MAKYKPIGNSQEPITESAELRVQSVELRIKNEELRNPNLLTLKLINSLTFQPVYAGQDNGGGWGTPSLLSTHCYWEFLDGVAINIIAQ